MRLTNDPQLCLRYSQSEAIEGQARFNLSPAFNIVRRFTSPGSASSSGAFCCLAAQHVCRGEALLDPGPERCRRAVARRIDPDEAARGAASDLQRPDMPLR